MRVKINETLEEKIRNRVISFSKHNYPDLKYKKIVSKFTHEYCKNSQYNSLRRYWEMF